jgi:hypothetical protein
MLFLGVVCSDDTDHLIPGHIDQVIELTLGVQRCGRSVVKSSYLKGIFING